MERTVLAMEVVLEVHVLVVVCGMETTANTRMDVAMTLTVMDMASALTCRVHLPLPINVSVMRAGMDQCAANVILKGSRVSSVVSLCFVAIKL